MQQRTKIDHYEQPHGGIPSPPTNDWQRFQENYSELERILPETRERLVAGHSRPLVGQRSKPSRNDEGPVDGPLRV